MKKLFPGLDSAVIIRSPAKRRTAKVGPPTFVATWDPPTVPDKLWLIYSVKSGQFRLATFYSGQPAGFILNVADRLAGGTLFQGLRGGWLFNEQVVSHLDEVAPL